MSESEEKTCNDDSKQPTLVLDLVISILQRLSFSDFHRARCISTEWYSASKSCIGGPSTPWIIMFPYADGTNNDSSCKLFNPRDHSSYTLRDLGFDMARSRCLASSGSWFLMLDHKLDFHLLNLFTGEMILLPPLESIDGCPMEFVRTCDSKVWVTLNNENKAYNSGRKTTSYTVSHLRIHKGVLWVDEESRDYLVVWSYDGLLAYHKKGDDDNNSWKMIQPLMNQRCVDMVCKESKLYVLSDTHVTVLDFSRADDSPIECASFKSPNYRRSFYPKNLAVTLSEEVLIVINNGQRTSSICFFDVYKMDPKSLEWRKINSIGDEALLFDLGITVAAKDGVLKNCIYFYTAVPYQSRGSFVRNADSGIRVYHIRTKNVVQVYQPALTASSPISFRSARWFLNSCFKPISSFVSW